MTNDPFPDDSWDELTRELGVEKAPPEPRHPPADSHPQDEPLEEGEFDSDLGEEGEGEPLDGTELPAGEDAAGGRKRRRRRRRRKKGEGETGPAGTEESAPEQPAMPARPHRREEPEFGGDELDSRPYDDEPVGVPLAAEEDTAGEVLRDLIANWNVPSWDSIISGLNR
jgi:hypothetical protein